MNHSRRSFVKHAAIATAVTPAVLNGCSSADSIDRGLKFTSLSDGLKEAERLAAINPPLPANGFSLSQTLIHCAQSIEYSLSGFPQPKSAVFQRTVGSLAFTVFSWRGSMSHDLAQAIPGAEALDTRTPPDQALARLETSIYQFENTSDPLQPHFACGPLDKQAYALAHAMHLANHFSAIDT